MSFHDFRLACARCHLLPALLLSLAAGQCDAQSTVTAEQTGGEWTTYGANLASHRYSPLDQINADNFKDLEVVWRLRTDFLGPRPDGLYGATPLYVNNTLYTTAGTRRAVIAMDPATGEILWLHRLDEGERGTAGARQGAGRGVAYWESDDGKDQRILYVTPGYRLIALDARTGAVVTSFGDEGIVDLKQNFDQDLDPLDPGIGLNATPLVVGDVIVVGASHRPTSAVDSTWSARGYVRGFDIRTGKRLWIFHTIPLRGEYGYDSWHGKAEENGNVGVWSQMSADPELGLVYLPVEMAAADYNGYNRPGDGLFGESLVAVDVQTGKRKWHYQTIHHGIWDWDLPCAPILFDMQMNGRTVKALAQPTKSAFLFVLDRETGEPIWPIEERAVPQSESQYETTSPTQPFPTWPKPFDRQGVTPDDLNDLTPALKAEAEAALANYRIGPIFTPPALATEGGPTATLMLPGPVGGANWPGGSFDPKTNRLYIHSHTQLSELVNTPSDMVPFNRGPGGEAPKKPGALPGLGPRPGLLGSPGGLVPRRPSVVLQGTIPMVKPPYDRITAYDMNTGEMVWQKTHGTTEDAIRNNPALAGVPDIDRLGSYGRIFIGTLTTATLVVAGEGATHTNERGETVALLRAYDKATGADIEGRIEMPARQTGSPMTFMHNGKQYIVVSVTHSGANVGGEIVAYALP
ncbi:MAG: PQQ-binding-like beta-propeller repeat protein [Gammaproteobacteria bacterium]|nr:PQQ-binding-like beta-propeller repeat protein [Gammaproteobacteria bacterium]